MKTVYVLIRHGRHDIEALSQIKIRIPSEHIIFSDQVNLNQPQQLSPFLYAMTGAKIYETTESLVGS